MMRAFIIALLLIPSEVVAQSPIRQHRPLTIVGEPIYVLPPYQTIPAIAPRYTIPMRSSRAHQRYLYTRAIWAEKNRVKAQGEKKRVEKAWEIMIRIP